MTGNLKGFGCVCDLGFLGFDLGFNLEFSRVLNEIFEGFLVGLGFRVLREFWKDFLRVSV